MWKKARGSSKAPFPLSWSVMRVYVLNRFSHVQLFVIVWTIIHKAPLSMGFCRQRYWSGLTCPSPGDLPHPGLEPMSLMSPALADRFCTTSSTWEALISKKRRNIPRRSTSSGNEVLLQALAIKYWVYFMTVLSDAFRVILLSVSGSLQIPVRINVWNFSRNLLSW